MRSDPNLAGISCRYPRRSRKHPVRQLLFGVNASQRLPRWRFDTDRTPRRLETLLTASSLLFPHHAGGAFLQSDNVQSPAQNKSLTVDTPAGTVAYKSFPSQGRLGAAVKTRPVAVIITADLGVLQ